MSTYLHDILVLKTSLQNKISSKLKLARILGLGVPSTAAYMLTTPSAQRMYWMKREEFMYKRSPQKDGVRKGKQIGT